MIGTLFNEVLVRPILNGLLGIYHILQLLHVPYELGFAILILTIAVRFLLYPLTVSQLRSTRKLQELNPHVSNIKEKHKGDSKRIQEETMRLYKEHGVNPFSGCLPLLIQIPMFYAIYNVLQKAVMLKADGFLAINKEVYFDFLKLSSPWNLDFFGVSLGQNPSHLFSTAPLVILIPVITGALQFIQSKMMLASGSNTAVVSSEKKDKEPDFASAFQTQSVYIVPLMIGFFSYSFPIGISIYWNTFTLFGILQQYKTQGLGGLESLIVRLKK